MNLAKRKQDCCGCYACYNVCPVNAIDMCPDEEGFVYPIVNSDKCVGCNRCEMVCPMLHETTNVPMQIAYGCYAKNHEEQKSSSSGGVFAVLARAVFSAGGIVCGAVYDEKHAVYHIVTDSQTDLYYLKGTKYVQSRIEDVFKKIKDSLDQNIVVLFSGTPCQVVGLKMYLGKEYEKLLCVDLICHGVPSAEVWQRYLSKVADGNKVKKVTFRDKSQGISNITLNYHLDNGNVIKEKYTESLYMKGFIQNLFIRPSCFECRFKGSARSSDITIGDFWAVKEYHPDFYTCDGVSAVIINSEKGMSWFKKIGDDLNIVKSNLNEIACWNDNLIHSAKKNSKRYDFFKAWNNNELMELIHSLTENNEKVKKITLISKLKNMLNNALNHI